jgi:hypothetical protein
MHHSLLDELNELLRRTRLGLPEHAREVHSSGKNYKWLKKNLGSNPDVPPRIRELLSKSLNELTKHINVQV